MSLLLIANENIPLASIKALRIAGFDVLAIVESYRGENDRKVLSVATNEQRILITFDRDYGELIFKERMPVPPAVIHLRFEPTTPAEPAEILSKFLMTDATRLVVGHYWVITRRGIRSRKLPFKAI